jgi:hypothetical protein
MLLKFVKKIKDGRRKQGQRFQLHYIIFFSILAILCGAEGYKDIERFIDVYFKKLCRKFRLKWIKRPAYTTIRNIILGINKDSLEKAFREYTEYLEKLDKSADIKCIAIDGKTLRGSFDHFNDKKALHVLSTFLSEKNLILHHYEVDDKSNEIPALQKLLTELGIKGAILTMDAMHCQINTFWDVKKGAMKL